MLVLALIGGVLTILGPCILLVLPLLFARDGRSFAAGTPPMLAGHRSGEGRYEEQDQVVATLLAARDGAAAGGRRR